MKIVWIMAVLFLVSCGGGEEDSVPVDSTPGGAQWNSDNWNEMDWQ